MAGISDINIFQNFVGSSVVYNGSSPEPSGYSFKISMATLIDGDSNYWPTDEIIVQLYNSSTQAYKTVLTTNWSIYNNYIYVQDPSVALPSEASLYSITAYRADDILQDYAGDAWNSLTPQAIAASLDKNMRATQRALLLSHMSLKVHPQDTTVYDTFTGRNVPDKLTLPQDVSGRAGKALGWDPTGTKIVDIGDAVTATTDTLNTPLTAVLRDSNGNAKMSDPVAGQDIATKSYVDNGAIVSNWNILRSYSQNDIINRSGVIYKSVVSTNIGQDPATDTTGAYWTPAGGGSTIIDYYTAGATITAGQWVRVGSSGIVPAYTGLSLANAGVIGIALTSGAAASVIKVQTFGIAKAVTTGRTAGDVLYLGITAGTHTTDMSVFTYGFAQVRVGISINATDIFVCPDMIDFSSDYIANKSGLRGISGWATYLDTAGSATPVDGTGGSPTVTLAQNSTTPLDQQTDFLFTKAAGTSPASQGQGFSTSFSIDRGDLGAALQISFKYKTSANYVSGDLQVFIYDVTNATLIPVSYQSIDGTNTGVGQFIATFYPSTSLSYRLIFHVATVNLLAYTVNAAKVQVSPQTALVGPVMSDEIAYTPTFVGFGTPTGVNFKWRRVGNKMQIRGTFTAGTTTAVEAQIGLPAIGVNTPSDLPTLSLAGRAQTNLVGVAGDFRGTLIMMEASKNYMTVGRESTASGALVKGIASSMIVTGDIVSFFAEVPIAQWSVSTTYQGLNEPFCLSNAETVANTAGVVGKTYQGWDGAPIVANTALTYYDMTLPRALLPNEVPSLEFYSATTKDWTLVFDASIPSLWIANFRQHISSGGNIYPRGIWLAKVSSGTYRVYFSADVSGGGSAWSGSTETSRTWANIIAAADGFTRWRVRIGKSSGVAEIAPKIRASYYIASFTFTTASVTVLNPTTRDFDAYSTVSSGVFTARLGGVLRVTVSGTPSTALHTLYLYKNGVAFRKIASQEVAVAGTITGSMMCSCSIGDTFDVRCDTSGIVDTSITLQFELDS